MALKAYRTIVVIGVIEVAMGAVTFLVNVLTWVQGVNDKSPGVLLFVMTAAVVSFGLGIGLLRLKQTAYWLLLYFSSLILISKLAILLGVIELNGALYTLVPGPIKNTTSLFYHGFLIYYLWHKDVREAFHP